MDDQGTQTILVLLPSFISGFGNRWIGYMIICNAFFLFHHNYRLSRTIWVFCNFLALMCFNELTWCDIKIVPPSDTLYNKTNYCIHHIHVYLFVRVHVHLSIGLIIMHILIWLFLSHKSIAYLYTLTLLCTCTHLFLWRSFLAILQIYLSFLTFLPLRSPRKSWDLVA